MAAEEFLVKFYFIYLDFAASGIKKVESKQGKRKKITNKDAQRKIPMARNQSTATGKVLDINQDSFLKIKSPTVSLTAQL